MAARRMTKTEDDNTASSHIYSKPDLTSHTLFKLIVLNNFIMRPFSFAMGKAHGLTLTEWRVLFIVGGRPGITGAEIIDQFGFEKMALSRAIARLEARGRVVREIDPADRRRAVLHLTPEASEFLRRETPRALDREAILEACLTPDEHREFDRMLDKIIETLKR